MQRQFRAERKDPLTNGAGTLGYVHAKKKASIYTSHHMQKLTKQWVTDLNAKCRIIRFIEENLGGNVCDSVLGKDFFLKDIITQGNF